MGKPECLSFYYHMYGADMGSMNVFVKTASGETLITTFSGSKRNLWLYYSYTVEESTKWNIIFEGKRAVCNGGLE